LHKGDTHITDSLSICHPYSLHVSSIRKKLCMKGWHMRKELAQVSGTSFSGLVLIYCYIRVYSFPPVSVTGINFSLFYFALHTLSIWHIRSSHIHAWSGVIQKWTCPDVANLIIPLSHPADNFEFYLYSIQQLRNFAWEKCVTTAANWFKLSYPYIPSHYEKKPLLQFIYYEQRYIHTPATALIIPTS